MKYIEIAIDTPRNRGHIINRKELASYINIDKPLYRSLYLYSEEGKEQINDAGSVSNFYGPRWIDKILIDIDKGDSSNEETLKRTCGYLLTLEEYGLNINKSVQPFFSGSGYHLIIPNSVFNFEPSP